MSHFKPNVLKKTEGKPGHRRLNKPPEVSLSVPECPGDLPAAAKAEWERIVPLLDEYNLLSQLDRATLADYCLCVCRLDEAEQDITARGLLIEGDRGKVKNPSAQLARQYRQALAKWAEFFGLAAGPRGRMNVQPPVAKNNKWAEFAELDQPRLPRPRGNGTGVTQ